MKTNRIILLLSLCLPALLSFEGKTLLDKPMPVIPGKTLNDTEVNEQYFKGHRTLVSFMYVGCPPCMNEVGAFNRLKKDFAGDSRFQLLCIARQMRSQMLNFNANNKSYFSHMRRTFGVDSIQYEVLPACPETLSKMDSSVKKTFNGKDTDIAINIRLNTECELVGQVYGITAYPTLFFVDEHGIIRKIEHGGPAKNHDEAFYKTLKAEVDSFLRR